MAWTDACKLEAVAQIDKRKEAQGGVKPAIRDLSKESGIPKRTLERWYWPDKEVSAKTGASEAAFKSEPGPHTFTNAMQIAIFVISHLERIMADDPKEKEAINKVNRWTHARLNEIRCR